MARLKGPLLSYTASGNFAGTIQYRTKSGATHAHRAPDPKSINQQTASIAQDAIRKRYAALVAAWQAMGEQGRESYRAEAKAVGAKYSGWNLYVKLHINEGAIVTALTFSEGAPSAGLGSNGDFCLDYAGFMFYGPKSGGLWGVVTKIETPAGVEGAISALGLGTAATHAAEDFAPSGYAAAVVNSSIKIWSAQTVTSNGALTKINFDTGATGDGEFLSVADNGFKIPAGKDGVYKPECAVVYTYPAVPADSYYCKMQILVNDGVTYESSCFASFPTGTGNRDIKAGCMGLSLSAGDVVTFKIGIKSINTRMTTLTLNLAYSYAHLEKLS